VPDQHFVIDGSNIATEGRTSPSFAQLREALAAFRSEHPDATVTLVVDASFEHRIDESEVAAFKRAEAGGELVSPPAGAIGRGDGFLLQIADRTGATVVSNDSFQEFHGQYDWLFQVGRLIGGKPVPGVGWIFSLRSPVRGARSRKAVREAEKAEPEPTPKRVTSAIAEATRSAIEGSTPRTSGRSRRRRSSGPPPVAVNEPAAFLRFVIDHRPGMPVEGRVTEFASHGAFVEVDGVRCYVPLSAMGDPPPNSAREVLSKGSTARFVVQAIDAPRRGIELAVPGFEKVAGAPSEETVEAEADASERAGRRARRTRAPGAPREAAAPAADGHAPGRRSTEAGAPQPARKGPVRRGAADRSTPAEPEGAEGAPAKRSPATKAAGRKAAAAKRAAADGAAAKKTSSAPKAAAPEKAAASRRPAPAPKAPDAKAKPDREAKGAGKAKGAAKAATPRTRTRKAVAPTGEATTDRKAPAAAKAAPPSRVARTAKAAAPAGKAASAKVEPGGKAPTARKAAAAKKTAAKKTGAKKAAKKAASGAAGRARAAGNRTPTEGER